jgi:hypothetical protein
MKHAVFLLLIGLVCLPVVLGACDANVCGVGGNCQDPVSASTTCVVPCGTLSGLQSYLYPTDSKCYVNCPSDSFKNTAGGRCDLCDGSCNGCSGSALTCLSCAANYYRKIGSDECTNACGTGYYGDKLTVQCTVCPNGCATCSMPVSTISCASCTTVGGSQYYLSGTTCVANCPSGTFGDTSSSPACTACTAPCATCSGSGTACLSCSTGTLIYGANSCSGSCPNGQYNPGSNFCQLCSSNCATCTSYSVCASCGVTGGAQTYLHSDNQCYATCPNGYFG